MITLAQPSLVLNSFGIKSNYGYSMWRTWNMPQSATSKDVVYWIAIACDQAPELALNHVVLHAHGNDGTLFVGQDPAGNDNTIDPSNVADFQALASKDIGCIWLHACSPAATAYGARFCLQLAANIGLFII